MNRRDALKSTLALAATAAFGQSATGRIVPRKSADIAASRLSVGFETLDRFTFEPERAYPHLAELGVKWARCQTGWSRCETKPGEYDFGWLDDVVDNLRGIGIQPWFNLGYGNQLYAPRADRAAVGWAPVFDDASKLAWTRFVTALAAHFADRVTHWELWNEPNISGFWKPSKPDPVAYTALARMSGEAIRSQVPQAFLVGPGYAGMPARSAYLKACFEAGLADVLDAVSYHPYRPVPEAGYGGEVKALREMTASYKPGMQLWQGENGCPSTQGSTGAPRQFEWTEERQAKWLLRRILVDLAMDLDLTSYFCAVDLTNYTTTGGGSTANLKGLIRHTEYTRKPSFSAYQHVCAIFDATAKLVGKGLRLTVPEGVKYLTYSFEKDGRPLHLCWSHVSLQERYEPPLIEVDGEPLQDAVVVDLLDGTVRELPGPPPWKLPLRDYPLLLTERGAVLG